MKKLFNRVKKENGQVVLMTAMLLVVLMGFTAFAIDLGMVEIEKAKLQNAADAAALAGANELPNAFYAVTAAKDYAQKNGVEQVNTTATAPYESDLTLIEVVCTGNVKYVFAPILGFTDIDVSARAVAHKLQWEGEAMPFINLDDDYLANPDIESWEKTSSGTFESIDGYEIINPNDPDRLYFQIDYVNGVEIKRGTVATIKQEVGYVYEQHKPDKPVYVLSLNSDVIRSGVVKLVDGSIRSLSGLYNNDIIDPSQLVLMECIFNEYDSQGKTLYLTCQRVYDIANNESPADYVSPDGYAAKLVE